MSDILAARFVAIADLADDGDWREVRRRAREGRRRWHVVPLAVAAAGVVAAVAMAANNGWVFRRTPYSEPSFARTFQFQGASWSIVGYLNGEGGLSCFSVGRTEALLSTKVGCRIHLLTPPGLARAAITSNGYDHRGGQIWFGDAQEAVARVVIADDRGHTFTAPAVTAPALAHPTARFRLWLIALPSSRAISIAAYDRNGKRLYRESVSGQPWATPANVH